MSDTELVSTEPRVSETLSEVEAELRTGVNQTAEGVKREAKAAKAASDAFVEKAADKAANTVNDAANATAKAANNAEAAANDFQSRFKSGVGYIRDRAQIYSKDPQQLGSAIRYQLDARVRDRILIVFLLMWAPIWIMAIGSGFGTILKLFLHNLNYAVGIAAAGYVWTLLNSTGTAPQYQAKILQILLICSGLPIFILDVTNPILKVFTLLAFGGAPFLLYLIYSTGITGEKEDLNKNVPQERLIQFATASSAIFGLSVLPGDNNLFHRLFIAVVFAGSAFAVQTFFPLIEQRIPPNLKPQVEPHKVTIFALLEILIGNLILFILSYVLPLAVVENESSAGAIILYTLLGLIFLEVGNVLSNNFLADVAKLPPATVGLIRKAGAGAIGASYLVLMVSYILHWGPFGQSQ